MMTGYGGTSKSGRKYYYYACKKAKKKLCQKKIVNKQAIEDKVVSECYKLLTDANIDRIAKAVSAACQADYDNSAVKRLRAALHETDVAIENLWKAMEQGQSVERITERIERREQEKESMQTQLTIELGKQIVFTEPQIKTFLYALKRGDINDENTRRGIVNIFLQAIYLYDDRMTLVFNGGDTPITIDDILLDEIEGFFNSGQCSNMRADAPPKRNLAATRPLVCVLYVLRELNGRGSECRSGGAAEPRPGPARRQVNSPRLHQTGITRTPTISAADSR